MKEIMKKKTKESKREDKLHKRNKLKKERKQKLHTKK